MSFPVLVLWGDKRKLPRLRALLFLSEVRHNAQNSLDVLARIIFRILLLELFEIVETLKSKHAVKRSSIVSSLFLDTCPQHRWRHRPGSQQLLLSGELCGTRWGRNETPTLETERPQPPNSQWHLTLKKHAETQKVFLGRNLKQSRAALRGRKKKQKETHEKCHLLRPNLITGK